MIKLFPVPESAFMIKVPNATGYDCAVIEVQGITAHLMGWTGSAPTWEVAQVISTLYPDVEYLSWMYPKDDKLQPIIKLLNSFVKV